MTPSRDLFELIHSLTVAEKRYVRRTARMSGRKTAWLRLFDAIGGQRTFDEEELRVILKGDAMLGNFSVAKRYVYQAVLRALRSYGTGRDFDSELGEMIEEYKVLIHKGLYPQAARLMRRIKRRALAGDAYLRLFWTIIVDFNIASHSTEQSAMDYLEGKINEQFSTLQCIENYSIVGSTYFRQRIILRHKPIARTARERERLSDIMAPLLGMNEDKLLTPTARGFYHLAMGDYWEAMGKPALARPHFDRFLVQALLDLPIGTTDSLHLAEFTNALFFRIRHNMTEGLEGPIETLRNRSGNLDRRGQAFTTQVWFYERWLVASLMLLNVTGRVSQAAVLLRNEEERTQRLWIAISKKMRHQLLHLTAGIRLTEGDHAGAIAALNKVLNDGEKSTEEYGTAMLLALVAHVEAGNTGWLDAAFRSAERHLNSRGRYIQTEKAMITGLRRVLKARNTDEERAAYQHLHNRLVELFKDPRERTISVSMDLLAWTRAHASGIAFDAIAANRN